MRRYLVIANQTLGGETLRSVLRERIAAGECSFHVVVPATPSGGHLTWTEGEAHAVAGQRLDDALAWIRDAGAQADGEVGDPKPVQAIGDALRTHPVDEIILSTLPPGLSRWLRQDLPHRVERTFGIPVTHVVAAAETAGRVRG